MNKKIEAGDVFPTSEGGEVRVVKYRNSQNIDIVYMDENRHRAIVTANTLRKGKMKNPYHRSVLGVGYVGVGRYRVSNDGKLTDVYRAWGHMLERCYNSECQEKRPTYIGCFVCPDWLNFQAFAEWFHIQPNSDNAAFHLDKDLMMEGNKTYGPEFCSFVPGSINSLLTDAGAARGRWPMGVSANGKGFQAYLSVGGKRIWLGTYATPELAFSVYRRAKEANVKSMAEDWREYLHDDVYEYLSNFKVKQ